LPGVTTVVKEHGGPAAARNAGVAHTTRDLVLFLGDDMVPVPELVENHLEVHRRHPEDEAAGLGTVAWHPDAGERGLLAWVDRSRTQFDFAGISGDDAGWGRFYSCNVSLKRRFFLAAGGFDEDFTFAYEDLDMAWRLHERGLRLVYRPAAKALHLHDYDIDALRRRWEGIARGERLMLAKHPWFAPWFEPRARAADRAAPVRRLWPRLAGLVPGTWSRRTTVVERADSWYLQQLAPWFVNSWEGDRGIAELKEYLGEQFDPARLHEHRSEVEREERASPDEHTFYRTSDAYLYDLTAFATWPTKVPYRRDLRRLVGPGARVLDYGCGIGTDGLHLLDLGYRVEFADFDNPSTRYLRWRLEHRGLDAAVHDVERSVPGGFDLTFAFDVIEHVDDAFAFLATLEERAGIVMVNLLEPQPDDPHLHRPLPIGALLAHATRRGLVRYRRYHGGSHLIAYRSAPRRRSSPRSILERAVGSFTPGEPRAQRAARRSAGPHVAGAPPADER
jgi:hypothetical protein